MSAKSYKRKEMRKTTKLSRQVPNLEAERATSGMAMSGSLVGTWNVRGQDPGEWAPQAIHESIKHDLGIVCLSEVNCGGYLDARTIDFHDTAGDTWTFLSVGEEASNTRGTGFLVAPRFETVEFRAFSPRVSILTLRLSKDPFWRAVMGLGNSAKGKKGQQESEEILGVVSCYAPTESKGTPADVDAFYNNLEAAVAYFRTKHGFNPVIGGDFNINVGEHTVDESEPYESVTGPRSKNRKSSPNCTFLYTFCVKKDYVIANTYESKRQRENNSSRLSPEEQRQKEIRWSTWFHPRTQNPHVKDLILVPRGALATLSKVMVVHEAACGNNDHSLVVCGLKSLTRRRWRDRAHTVSRGASSQSSRTSSRMRFLPSRGGNVESRTWDVRTARKTGSLGPGTTPRPGLTSRMSKFEFKDVSKRQKKEFKLELRRRLEPLPQGWEHTVKEIKAVCRERLAEKVPEREIPMSWVSVSGGTIGELWKKIARIRSKLAGAKSLELLADLVQTRLKAKREKRRCQRICSLVSNQRMKPWDLQIHTSQQRQR
jgi:hypothetical protein